MYLVSGGIAALISFLFNRFFVKYLGNKAIYTVVPIIEEISKTLAPFFLSTSILYTHIVFGIIEALYDGTTSPKKVAFTAALMSIVTHGILGAISSYTFAFTNNVGVAIFAAWIFHLGWNYFIAKL